MLLPPIFGKPYAKSSGPGDLDTQQHWVRAGGREGSCLTYVYATVGLCSVGLDSLYSITQVASVFDLPTHTYTLAHTHVHIIHIPKTCPGRMDDVQAQPHPLMAT